MVTDLGCLHPSMNTHLSVSTLRSSTSSAEPRSLADRSSRLLTIRAPVARDILVMSDSFTRLTARILAFARYGGAISPLPFWQTTPLPRLPLIWSTSVLTLRFLSQGTILFGPG